MTGSQAEVGVSGAQRIGAAGEWLSVLRRYLAVIAVGNLAWEFAQLPLYTIWHGGTPREIAFAALHCTGGDVLIAGAALLGALLVAGTGEWPHDRFATVAVLAMLGGNGRAACRDRVLRDV